MLFYTFKNKIRSHDNVSSDFFSFSFSIVVVQQNNFFIFVAGKVVHCKIISYSPSAQLNVVGTFRLRFQITTIFCNYNKRLCRVAALSVVFSRCEMIFNSVKRTLPEIVAKNVYKKITTMKSDNGVKLNFLSRLGRDDSVVLLHCASVWIPFLFLRFFLSSSAPPPPPPLTPSTSMSLYCLFRLLDSIFSFQCKFINFEAY